MVVKFPDFDKYQLGKFMLTFIMSDCMGKPTKCLGENKDADQLAGTTKLISTFVFATQIVKSLFYLNTKFQASDHLL